MKVLLVSTSEQSGGGAIAAYRLASALSLTNDVEVKLLVRDGKCPDVAGIGYVRPVGNKLPKFLERLCILPHVGFSRKRLWQVDTARMGIDITRTPEFREADVVHLHWVNQGMLSLDGIRRILQSGKRVVWTLHDEWPYLGVCHYRGDCKAERCYPCPLYSGHTPMTTLQRKRDMFRRWHPTFVGCSQWITDQARRALPQERVVHINNCIPSVLFSPSDVQQARRSLSLPPDKRLLLFCSQKVTDERKGISYLAEALNLFGKDELQLVIVGKDSEKIPLPDGIKVHRLGSVGERDMPLIYNAADAFVTPSLQDNLPNTIAEAMSCGTPCVGFNVGGIPEMIDHCRNGYVARYRDAADLAAGIRYVLSHDLRKAAHEKAKAAYDMLGIAQQYIQLYNEKS